MLTCKQASLLVSQSYDRRLSWRERLGVRIHLAICDACTQFTRQMDFLRKAMQRFRLEQVETVQPTRISAEALERIARYLDRHP
jgi:Putative zinc-finger